MVSDRSVKVAKYGPVTALVCIVGLVVVAAVAAQAFDSLSPEALSRTIYFAGLGALFSVFGVVGLYQAQFILRYPTAAIEHDVQPPSKYDLSFETRRGAKKIGALALLGSVLSLALGVGAIVMSL